MGDKNDLIRGVKAMAERAGKSERTIYGWLKRPEAACFGLVPLSAMWRRWCRSRARWGGRLLRRARRPPSRDRQQRPGRGGTSARSRQRRASTPIHSSSNAAAALCRKK